jgi:hypothetical protein
LIKVSVLIRHLDRRATRAAADAGVDVIRPLVQSNGGPASAAFLRLYAGQAAPRIRYLPAARLIDSLVTETRYRFG